MKVLLIGHGGREHALGEALAGSEGVVLYSWMKNCNPGLKQLSRKYTLGDECNGKEVSRYAKAEGIDLAVIGPEDPEASGVVDELESADIPVANPNREGARIETSKSFMRELLKKHRIDANPVFGVFDSPDEAKKFVKELNLLIAIKPIGLTGGKGVRVYPEHFRNLDEASREIENILENKTGGESKVLIEEKMEGEEFTLQAFCDGNKIIPTPLVQDHKRLCEGDTGPNTGGMGSYSLANGLLPFVEMKEKKRAADILKNIVDALSREGIRYKGAIYGQFMLGPDKLRITEINARWGDPEVINVMPLLKSDFAKLCMEMAEGKLLAGKVKFDSLSTVCKYLVPEGYGTSPLAGERISVDQEKINANGVRLYYATVDEREGALFTTSSRSVALLGVSKQVENAEKRVEMASEWVKGKLYMRHDIGKKALLSSRIEHMERLRKMRVSGSAE
jgi:phosphoribosylamine--glycine ligase